MRTRPFVPLALALFVLTAHGPAHAQRRARTANPSDAATARLAAEVRRTARQPHAAVALARIYQHWDRASPGLTTRTLSELASDRRLPAALRAYAAELHASLWVREGHVDEGARAFRDLGFVTQLYVIGAFDNEGKAGFDRVMPPEEAERAPFDPSASYPGRERTVSWRVFPDVARWGYVNLGATVRPSENACAYAQTFLRSDRARPLTLWVGAGGAVRVWFNGTEVLRDAAYRSGDYDRAVAMVPARAGANRVLLKVCNADGPWGFYLRVGDATGAPAEDVVVDLDAREAAPAPATPIALPPAPVPPLAALEAAIAAHEDDARAHEDLARWLDATWADDPADRRALREAERAAELEPTWERWLLVADLREERAEVMRAVDEAERLAPREPEVMLERALLLASGPDPDRALDVLARIEPATEAGMTAAALRAALLADLELPRAALAEVERASQRAPGSIYWLRQRASAIGRLGRVDAQYEVREALLAAAHDDSDTRRAIVNDALARHDRDRALHELEAARALLPDDARTLAWAAAVYETLGMTDEMLAARRAVIDLAPEDADAHVAYGRTLLRHDQTDAAAAAFRRVLELRPQDESVRRLLEEIRPAAARRDERFATATEDILARRRPSSGWHSTVLHDLTVDTVFENGLSTSFHQIATQVHDAEGAREWRGYSIPFDPATEWVEIRSARVIRPDGTVIENVRTGTRPIGDPRYRIYYGREARRVVFPELRAGDTIELRYRVNEIAYRNVFHDYFGTFRLLQRGVPTAHLEHVLVTPASRHFYFNEPRLASLRHETSSEGDTRIDRFVADDVEPLRSEPYMPGASEAAPYLHVSTYRTWDEVGRFFWGLVHDNLVSDEALTRTVRELVASARTTQEKVERIYAWVIRNTRYVGLEFGIHGYQPYRVPLIVQRGFGDCKDKAALLYVMLREAGVDARMVLVRTRGNGDIDEVPASLAVFDHAIAYVPELDLYLDGTAENGGTNALPDGDQGVRVLVVGPDGQELRRTPVAPPDRAGRRIEMRVELGADGSGHIEEAQEIFGPSAAGYRTRYQAERTRLERLQQALAGIYPGLELEAPVFEDLDALERPVRFHYRARVPELAHRDGSSLVISPSRLSSISTSLGLTEDRRHAIDLGGTSSFREHRRIRLPAGASVAELPEGGVADSPFGRCEVRYARTGGQLEITTELIWRRDRIPVTDYPAFRRWVAAVDSLLRARVRIGGAR